jgi:glycosyltransferase involved in cell wall biosynthesis
VKVTLITNMLAPYRIPFLQELSQQDDIDLHILLLSRSEKNRDWQFSPPSSLNIKVLPDFGFDFSNRYEGLVYHINPTATLEILKGRFDVVIFDGWESFAGQTCPILCKTRGIPYITWVESTLGQPSKRRSVAKPLNRIIIKNAAAMVIPGSKAEDYVKSLGGTQEKIFIAPNSVDNEYFKNESEKYRQYKEELKSRLEINSELTILSIAQLIRRKGIHLLIEAFSLVRKEFGNVGLAILGEGKSKGELIRLCQKLKLKDVYFIGSVPYSQLIQYYALADIFALPSLEEVWGLVLNEAMACGLPVITTKAVGAVPDLIKDGEDGFVVNAGDSHQLHQAIKNMLQNRDRMKRMGQTAQQRVLKQFSPGDTAQGFIKAIEFARRGKRQI